MRDDYTSILTQAVTDAFDREALQRICEMDESEFAAAYDMDVVLVNQKGPANAYYFRDNGSDILAVAHLDTVALDFTRSCQFIDTEAGPVVFSRALDDRLGAYIILELLPQLGITHDILLTLGEEDGQSTAYFFEPTKDYNWMIEFDRGGTDVVLYQYEDIETEDLVYQSGARVGNGAFSDISFMEHLEIKGFNWGVGYQDYHGPRAHAFLEDTFTMVASYLVFEDANAETYLPHERYVRDPNASVIIWGDDNRNVRDWDFANDDPTAEELAEVLDAEVLAEEGASTWSRA